MFKIVFWYWWALAAVLLVFEMMLPGVVFMFLAIGALAREVRMQFLTEAVVLCCLGGLIGIGLALLLSWGLATAIEVPFLFDPTINVLSFVFSAVMGIAFGYYPASRASRLDPIDALRHE